jgi:hypothetical protein
MARARSDDKRDLFVEAKGKGKHATLTAADLRQLQEVWAKLIPGYGLFRERFRRHNRRLPRRGPDARGRSQVLDIADWKSSRKEVFSREELQWQVMDGNITVRMHP